MRRVRSQWHLTNASPMFELMVGAQTYLHPTNGGFVRYKFLQPRTQLEVVINKCKQAGWKKIDATHVVRKFTTRSGVWLTLLNSSKSILKACFVEIVH